jgi:hypothetical protein
MHFLGKYPLMDLVSVCHSSHSFVLIWSISLLPASVHLLLKCFKVSGIYSLWRLLFLEMLQHQLRPTSLLPRKLFWSAFIKPHMQQLLKGSVLLPGLKLPEGFCLHNKSCKLYRETLVPSCFLIIILPCFSNKVVPVVSIALCIIAIFIQNLQILAFISQVHLHPELYQCTSRGSGSIGAQDPFPPARCAFLCMIAASPSRRFPWFLKSG